MKITTINIASDFHHIPAGRLRSDGEFSGERFREDFLIPALKDGQVVVFVDSLECGCAYSFFKEAFGGLSKRGYSYSSLTKGGKLSIISNDPSMDIYADFIWKSIKENK